jgi:hypothetical protein
VRWFKTSPRYDIRGFAQSIKRDAIGAIHEVLVKHFISKFLGVTYGFKDCASWVSLFRTLLRRQRFLLIVLDDARYDAFARVCNRYLRGTLIKAKVPPPNTYGWLPRLFLYPEFNDVRVFYASIGIESHDIRIKSFVPRDRKVEVIPIKPNRAKHLRTVLPSEVNEVVMDVGLSGRDIIWYAQPHFPWIVDEELSIMLMRDVLIHDYLPPDTIRQRLKAIGVPRPRFVKAYYANLVLVLCYVRELIHYAINQGVDYEEIVVTSDHGEMLGELGLYLHQEYDLPQLTIVPWLKSVPRIYMEILERTSYLQ